MSELAKVVRNALVLPPSDELLEWVFRGAGLLLGVSLGCSRVCSFVRLRLLAELEPFFVH